MAKKVEQLSWWDRQPKTVKVLIYLIVSTILAELLVELGNIEQTFIVRISAQIVNLIIVFLQESVPAIQQRLRG